MGVYSVPPSVALYNADGSFRTPYYLVTIDLPAFGGNPALTLRLGSPAYTGPDGVRWPDGILEVGQMNAGGAWLTSRWNPADMDVSIADKRMTGQGIAETFHDYFPDYEFVGAPIHVQIAFSNTLSVDDYRTVFKGRIEEWRQMDSTGISFYCSQDRLWSKAIPPNRLTLTDFPYAPTDNAGVPRPILLGDWETGTKTIGAGVGTLDETWRAGVLRAAFPTLTVELESAAGATTSPKVMASDKDMLSNPEGLLYYENQLGVYAHSFAALSVTGSGPVYGQLADYQFGAAVIPAELDATTTSTNAQELIRKNKPYTLTGRATLDFDAGKKVIRLLLPDVSELGTFVDAYAYIWFNKPLTSGSGPRWGAEGVSNPDNLVAFAGAATSPTSGDTPHDSASLHVGPAALGGSDTVQTWADIKNTTLLVEVRNAGETMDVHSLVLFVVYKPSARIISPGVRRTSLDNRRFPMAGRPSQRTSINPFNYDRSSPDVQSFDAALYAYGTGVPDDSHTSGAADGTYTGTASALIEHPADIAHWALRELGGVGAGEVTTTAGDFGSFADARTTLSGYKLKCQIAEDQEVEDFLQEIGSQVLCWFNRRTTDPSAPFVAIPWATGATQNYRDATDLVNFTAAGSFVVRDTLRVDRTPLSSVVNALRVNFDYDPRTRAFAEQVYITPDGSRVYSSGYTTDGTRVTLATTSQTLYGRKDLTVNLKWVRDPATASSILTRLFDWRYAPRVVLKFNTFLNALDLERGHVLRMGSDWDSFLTYPKAGGDGSWASKNLQVFSVVKLRDLPVQYAVTAIET